MNKKTIYTLNINDYAPEITEITFPLMRHYAKKIGADFHVITDRKFPRFPVPYEKLQIQELARDRGDSWAYYIDADALVHPETIDFTDYIDKGTVVHNGRDVAMLRWRYDKYFKRDGRNIGSCNWFTIGSNWCLDLWEPLRDLSFEQAVANITPTIAEQNSGVIDAAHLLDDYTLSRNIAKYGLRFKTVPEICQQVGLPNAAFFWHEYTIPVAEKVAKVKQVAFGEKNWNLPKSLFQ